MRCVAELSSGATEQVQSGGNDRRRIDEHSLPRLLRTINFDIYFALSCRCSYEGALPTRLLAAWGDEDVISYHGFDFAKGEVIVFGGMENSDPDPISDISSSPSVASFDVTSVSHAF